MLHTIAQFIPILLIFLLISYFKTIAKFSNTVLGRLLAICIIVFYTILDKLLGAVVCLLVIFYYQSDLVETMLNMDIEDIEPEHLDHVDDYVYFDKEEKKNKKEGMMNYVDLYGEDFNRDILRTMRKHNKILKQRIA